MGPIRDMWQHMIGEKSKVMDKVIRVIQGANGVLTCGQKVLSKLDFRSNNMVGKKIREREKGETG